MGFTVGITGHTKGFGKHIKAKCIQEGYDVVGFSRTNGFDLLFNVDAIFETKFDVRVLAYLIGQGPNQEGPEQGIVENIVKVRLPREQVIFEDPHPRAHKDQFYKE